VKKHYGSENMQKLRRNTDKGVVWLTIRFPTRPYGGNLTPDEAQKVANHGRRMRLRCYSSGRQSGSAYGAKNTPNMVIIIGRKIVYHGAIDSKARPTGRYPELDELCQGALDQSLAGKSVSTPQTKPYGCSVKYKSRSFL